MRKPIIFTSEEKLLLSYITQSKIRQRQEDQIPKGKIDDLAADVIVMLNSEWDHHYCIDCSSFVERLIHETLLQRGVRLIVGFNEKLEIYIDKSHERQMDREELEMYISIFHKLRNTAPSFLQMLQDQTPVLEIVNFEEEDLEVSEKNIPAYKIVETTSEVDVTIKVKAALPTTTIIPEDLFEREPEVETAVAVEETLDTHAEEVAIEELEENIEDEIYQFHPVATSNTLLFELMPFAV